MNTPLQPVLLDPVRARNLETFLGGMRMRDITAQIFGLRLDLEIAKLEFAVDAVFSRHGLEVSA